MKFFFPLFSLFCVFILNASQDGFQIEMIAISRGTFQMGSNSLEATNDEKPVHTVTIRSFYLSKTEITQKQWQLIMGTNPSLEMKGDNFPVENISWADCQIFLQKLNQKTGKQYRLPTEAEWEYAARGGTLGDRYGNIDDIAWHGGNSENKPHEVATKKPNSFGLYDMLGNVWEWCQDWYGPYSKEISSNPVGPLSGKVRVYRGGSRSFDKIFCRASYRYEHKSERNSIIGFRIALDFVKD